jgi:hypothetical protein
MVAPECPLNQQQPEPLLLGGVCQFHEREALVLESVEQAGSGEIHGGMVTQTAGSGRASVRIRSIG